MTTENFRPIFPLFRSIKQSNLPEIADIPEPLDRARAQTLRTDPMAQAHGQLDNGFQRTMRGLWTPEDGFVNHESSRNPFDGLREIHRRKAIRTDPMRDLQRRLIETRISAR